jgi:hypothetical protein
MCHQCHWLRRLLCLFACDKVSAELDRIDTELKEWGR